MLCKKPGAIEHTRFFHQMPQQWQTFLEQTSGRERKNALQLLSEIVSDGNAALCADALELAGENGRTDADSLRQCYYMFKRIPRAKQIEFADQFIDILKIKTASRETPLSQLSGGNQQKVILARWLCTHPDFLILDEPTRGIDIGTKTEFQKLVLKFASEGMATVSTVSSVRGCVFRAKSW